MPDHSLQALEHAILYGDTLAVIALLDAHPDWLNVRFADNLNLTLLMWACRNRRESIVAELLRRGADVMLTNRVEANGDGGNTALWFAAQGSMAGTTGIADRLIAAGADVNRRCEQGQTALYIAASWVHLDLVQLLVEHGADASIPNAAGQTPLAALRNDLDWCGRQASLTSDQQRFRDGAPRVIAYLDSLG